MAQIKGYIENSIQVKYFFNPWLRIKKITIPVSYLPVNQGSFRGLRGLGYQVDGNQEEESSKLDIQ